MEIRTKEIGSSILKVKNLLKRLNQNSKDYMKNAIIAVKEYKSLLDGDKAELMQDIYIKYKYFDAVEAIKMEESIKNSKPVIKLLLSLNSELSNYDKNAEIALKKVRNLTAAETARVLENKAANEKLSEVKAYKVGKRLLSLDTSLGSYTLNANKALDKYKNLYSNEKILVQNNEKAKEAYNLALSNNIKCLLIKFDLSNDNHGFIGRESLSKFEDLSKEYQDYIMSNLFYRSKINMINEVFDKQASDEIIRQLHNVYIASIQSNLTMDYFAYALKVVNEFEGSKESVKRLVEAQAALQLKIAKDGKDAHPIVYLTETYLPDRTHSKYYEIADILISAYEFGLTNRQKKYFDKNIYAAELINTVKTEMTVEEQVV